MNNDDMMMMMIIIITTTTIIMILIIIKNTNTNPQKKYQEEHTTKYMVHFITPTFPIYFKYSLYGEFVVGIYPIVTLSALCVLKAWCQQKFH